MTNDATSPASAAAEPCARSRDWMDVVLKSLFALLVGVAIWWLVWMWVDGGEAAAQARGPGWVRNVLVPAWIIGVACLVALRHERHWSWPARRLTTLLPQVRDGQAPIEALTAIGGGVRQLVPMIQELLHEIRRRELAVAELNEEVRQRIANRTEALERRLGTLREQAARDALTGLYNRRMLDRILPRLIADARHDNSDLAVLMIDVDHFKSLNDTLGHAAGDALLRDISRLILSSLGGNDAAIRYGGDEFLVLLPHANAERAQALSRRLVSLVDGLARPLRVKHRPRLSIGMGLLSQVRGATADELLSAADRDLYQVKSQQRLPRALTTPA